MELARKTGVVLLAAAAMVCLAGGMVWGGGPESPPSSGTIQGPELWGVVIVECASPSFTAVRVKRVVDCTVETQTLVDPVFAFGCPADETVPMYWKFTGVTLFEIPGTPIITKVKNFEKKPEVASFDAQIKFWVP